MKLTWNSFQAACSRYWEGQQDKEAKTAAWYLITCDKEVRQTQKQVMASAYRLFKSENLPA